MNILRGTIKVRSTSTGYAIVAVDGGKHVLLASALTKDGATQIAHCFMNLKIAIDGLQAVDKVIREVVGKGIKDGKAKDPSTDPS